ncbi:MAG: UrcA family protein [Pseudomonadota bacterium]
MPRSTKLICALLAPALAAVALAPAALAGPTEPTVRNADIHFSASDLADPRKVDALRSEIRKAAREVCSLPGDRLSARAEERACRRAALAEAEAELEARLAASRPETRIRTASAS